jgi:hypothetical protein
VGGVVSARHVYFGSLQLNMSSISFTCSECGSTSNTVVPCSYCQCVVCSTGCWTRHARCPSFLIRFDPSESLPVYGAGAQGGKAAASPLSSSRSLTGPSSTLDLEQSELLFNGVFSPLKTTLTSSKIQHLGDHAESIMKEIDSLKASIQDEKTQPATELQITKFADKVNQERILDMSSVLKSCPEILEKLDAQRVEHLQKLKELESFLLSFQHHIEPSSNAEKFTRSFAVIEEAKRFIQKEPSVLTSKSRILNGVFCDLDFLGTKQLVDGDEKVIRDSIIQNDSVIFEQVDCSVNLSWKWSPTVIDMNQLYTFEYSFVDIQGSDGSPIFGHRIFQRLFERRVKIPVGPQQQKLLCRLRIQDKSIGWCHFPSYICPRKIMFDDTYSHEALTFSNSNTKVSKSTTQKAHKGWATALCSQQIHDEDGVKSWRFVIDSLPASYSLGLGIASRESNLSDCIGNDSLSLDVYANSGKEKLKVFYNSAPIGQLIIGRSLAKDDFVDFSVDFHPQEDDSTPQLKITWNSSTHIRLKLQFLKIRGFYPAVSIGNFKTSVIIQ